MMITKGVQAIAGRVLSSRELEEVSGGILENENLYPHKPGGVEIGVYVDGIYLGTATVNRGDPLGPFNPPFPLN